MVLRRRCRRLVRRRKRTSTLGARVADDRPRLGENGFRVETDGVTALLAIRARGPNQANLSAIAEWFERDSGVCVGG